MAENQYQWTDNPTVNGVSQCNTDVLNDCLMHLKYDKKDGGAGLQMFDTILKDHILTYEESKGLALQGTYVYKDAVAGSRYGYPDFYAKCLEEYNEAQGGVFEQPILTENGVMGGNTFAVNASSVLSTSSAAYKAFDATGDSTYWHSAQGFPQWIAFYNPNPLKVTSLQITNRKVDGAYPNAYILQASSDNITWTDITNGNGTSGDSVTWEITVPSGTIAYKYWRIYVSSASGSNNNYVAIDNIKINAVEILKKHPNGHLFYDIADKESIDDIFATTGMAWLYGVDTENERIFLPRNNWYEQATDNGSEVGQSVEAGLPNIKGDTSGFTGFEFSNGGNVSGAFKKGANSTSMNNGNGYSGSSLGFDASLSSSVYSDDCDTVQPNAVKKLLYICVGNTEVTSAVTDVTEVTTTENDTLPLGYHFYQAAAQPSVAYLKSQGQWNDGYVYLTFYNEFVRKIGQAFAAGYIKEITDEYDDYDLVINQTNMTFRLPLLDGSEDLLSDKYEDLTLEASESTYIAPANGWIYVQKRLGGTSQTYELGIKVNGVYIDSKLISTGSLAATNAIHVTVPVKKGDSFAVTYNLTGATEKFRCIYAQGNGDLYFKVANAVQNLELLDAGAVLETLSNKVDINSKVIDGQWVDSYLEAHATGTAGTYTIDLSNYLPNDGQVYNVKVRCYLYATTEGSAQLGSDILSLTGVGYVNGNSRISYNIFDFPVGAGRQLTYEIRATITEADLDLLGYRRVGTNE